MKILIMPKLALFALIVPLFFSISPIAFFYDFPGEVIPYAIVIAPLLFCFLKPMGSVINISLLCSLVASSFPFVLFATLDPGNYGLMVKNLAYLNPVLYFISYGAILSVSARNKSLPRPDYAILLACILMGLTSLLAYVSTSLLELLRLVIVNDLGNRSVADLLAYSGSPGLFSEPSYQALVSVSILSSSLVSPLRGLNMKVFLLSVAIVFLTKSLTGISFVFLYLFIRMLFYFLPDILAFVNRLVVPVRTLVLLMLLPVVVLLLRLLSNSYSRLDKLLVLLSELDFADLLSSMQSIESSFGSGRFAQQFLGCESSLLELMHELIFKASASVSEINSCTTGFSTFQQALFSLGFFGSTIFISTILFSLIRYSSSIQQSLSSLALPRPTAMSIFFTVLNVLILGPVASPFVYMPLLTPFGYSNLNADKSSGQVLV